MRDSYRFTSLRLEQLEDRLVPAGNVNVMLLSGGNVDVLGDSKDNGIEIFAGSSPGLLAFRGLDGTQINHQGDQLVLQVPGGLGTLNVNMGAGRDRVVISELSESAPIWPTPPVIPFLQIGVDLNILGGPGADIVQLRNVEVQNQLNIKTGGGSDVIVMESVKVDHGDALITTGLGIDRVLLRNVSMASKTSIATGAGNDAVGLIGSQFGDDALVSLGEDNDSVSVEGNTFNGDLKLFGGTGTNKMTRDLDQINNLNGAFIHRGLRNKLARVSEVHFTYEDEEGPKHWGSLTTAFLLSDVGREQTPIAINTATVVHAALPTLNFAYQTESNLPFIHNGHTVQVNFPGSSTNDTLTVNGDPYQLLQFHFHAPSEHTVDGQSFALELHLVHKDANGNLLVVTVLIKKSPTDTDNMAYDSLVAHLPTPSTTPQTVPSLNPEDLLPTVRDYYAYSGSLTTPPNSEGVSFAIFTTPVELSQAQIDAIANAIGDPNNRPIQPVNGRVVFVSN